jgi:hypothetical protein
MLTCLSIRTFVKQIVNMDVVKDSVKEMADLPSDPPIYLFADHSRKKRMVEHTCCDRRLDGNPHGWHDHDGTTRTTSNPKIGTTRAVSRGARERERRRRPRERVETKDRETCRRLR